MDRCAEFEVWKSVTGVHEIRDAELNQLVRTNDQVHDLVLLCRNQGFEDRSEPNLRNVRSRRPKDKSGNRTKLRSRVVNRVCPLFCGSEDVSLTEIRLRTTEIGIWWLQCS